MSRPVEEDHPAPPLAEPWPSTYARAVLFAGERHAGQRRKGSDEPYLVHPLRVCERLRTQAVPPVQDEVTLVAALLHDVLEDTATAAGELEDAFGAPVAAVVGELTNDTSLERAERKARMIERFRSGSVRARLVKLADRLDNLSDAPPQWSAEKWRAYLDESERLLAAMQSEPLPQGHPSDAQLAEAASLRASFADLAQRLHERIAVCRGNSPPPVANGPPV